MAYSPSPRPAFAEPTPLPFSRVVRHTWGDPEAGLVDDWIYVSTGLLHAIVFGMEPGGRFTHSEEFRTVFGADEVLHVLQGTLALANPETGEVLRVEQGESAFFRKDTWHHGFSFGAEPVRVLEFFSPPPSTGTSGPYARTRPYLPRERWRYGAEELVGRLPGATGPERRTLVPVRAADRAYRLEGDALVGLVASTEHLTVASARLTPAGATPWVARGGDVLVFVEAGELAVESRFDGRSREWTLGPWDAAYLPLGTSYRLLGAGDGPADAVVGVAPAYDAA